MNLLLLLSMHSGKRSDQSGFAASGLYPCFNRAFFITFASSATSEFGFGEPLKIEN